MLSDKSLINAIESDLRMSSYFEESEEPYYGRLIYTAMALWIKAITLDTNNSDENGRSKSKNYIFKRGTQILNELLSAVPQCYDWFWKCYNSSKKKEEHPIRIIRERMLCAGELVEIGFQTEIAVANENVVPILDGYRRYIGLEPLKYVDLLPSGITWLHMNKKIIVSEEPEYFRSTDFLNWLCNRAKWKKCSFQLDFEYFQPQKKDAPYRSWTDKLTSQSCGNINLGRIRLFNDFKEYYLLKEEDGKLFFSKIHPVLCEQKEERRVILALRKIAGNTMQARAVHKGKIIILKMFCRLPLWEERILQTFCWPKNEINDLLNFLVPIEIWGYIKTILIEMDIEVKE